MEDKDFLDAYERGRVTLDLQNIPIKEYHWFYRVYIGLWVAKNASKLEGDFVECGVGTGFLSSSICQYLKWNSLNKNFYLLDTFNGLITSQLTLDEQRPDLMKHNSLVYKNIDIQKIKQNFSEWKNIHIIPGVIPDTLKQVESDKISYLHVDLNCSYPEREVFLYFYKKLVTGGFILLDDYAYYGYNSQKVMWDKLAEEYNLHILSLPTGQGLILNVDTNHSI